MQRQTTHHQARPGEAGRALPAVRARLEHERSFRVEQLTTLSAEPGTQRGEATHAEIARAVRSAAVYALREAQDALARLDAGSYGSCEQCGAPVEQHRLAAVPTLRLCRRCQCSSPSRRKLSGPAEPLQALFGSDP